MEPGKNLSRRMGERAFSVYLPITGRGIGILAVDARMVLGRRGTCSDLRTRIPLVALVLCFAFTSLALAAPIFQAVLSASRVCFAVLRGPASVVSNCELTALLHLLQPLARLTGRLRSGLTFWRYSAAGFTVPWPRKLLSGPNIGAIPMKD